jgi:beta-glucosidase
MILLINDGVLPLRRDLHTIAVIGPNADSARNLQGDYSHAVHMEALVALDGFGSDLPEDFTVIDELAGRETILDAIRERAGSAVDIRYAPGSGIRDGDDAGIAAAADAARGAEVAIVVVGERSGLTSDCTCGEGRDRVDLGLSGRQADLVAAVAATGTPIVLVLVSGRPLAIESEAAASAAVIQAWVPGDEGPAAIAAILFGDANPGGKLPITVPRRVGQIPVYYGHKPSGGQSHWYGPYVDGSNLPLWPFGFGMSYTTFGISDIQLNSPRVAIDGEFSVSVSVRNTGSRVGDEVVQLYVRDEEASVTRPAKQLRGFKRVTLDPGQTRRVTFTLSVEQLAFTGVDGRLRMEPGVLTVMVGTSSEDLPCSTQIEVVGTARIIDRRTRYFTKVAVD